MIRVVVVVVRHEPAIFLSTLGQIVATDFLQELYDSPHRGAVDWERASAEETNVEDLADFFLETRIKFGIN